MNMHKVVFLLFFFLSISFSKILLGTASPSTQVLKARQVWQGSPDDVAMTYTNWVDYFTKQWFAYLVQIWNNNHTAPVVTWQPIIGWNSNDSPLDVNSRIARGDYDTYISSWIQAFDAFLKGPDGKWNTLDDRSAYLRLAHEMNGNWYPWSPAHPNSTSKPSDYIAMWRHVKNMFVAGGLTGSRLPFIFCPNNQDNGAYKMETFWPGEDFVDYIGIDGYNWGTVPSWSHWTEPPQVFSDMATRLRQLSTKPLTIPEFGSVREGGNKSQWIIDAYKYLKTIGAVMICYFNIDQLPDDLAAFGGVYGDTTFVYEGKTYHAYEGYKTAVQSINN